MVDRTARWMSQTVRSADPRAGRLAVVALICLASAAVAGAQVPNVHYWHHGVMPPGAIGSRQLQRGGPLPGYFQPVEIKAPPGALVSLAEAGRFGPLSRTPIKAGLLIGQVYRIKVTNIPLRSGMEVFPTIELIDRLYAPVEQQRRFPIPIELTAEDLYLALDGTFVTRVIYLEEPRQALPVGEFNGSQNWFDVGPSRDPLAVADAMGRPVAIVRLGARVPGDSTQPDDEFLFGSPPLRHYAPEVRVLPRPPAGAQPAPAPPEDARGGEPPPDADTPAP